MKVATMERVTMLCVAFGFTCAISATVLQGKLNAAEQEVTRMQAAVERAEVRAEQEYNVGRDDLRHDVVLGACAPFINTGEWDFQDCRTRMDALMNRLEAKGANMQ